MRIDVSTRNMELTDALRDYANEKGEKLPRYYDGVEMLEFVIEHGKNDSFVTEIRASAEKHDTFVATANGDNVYGTIDLASDKLVRQLTDFKEKLRNNKR
ncbi:MAG: ribosome-associated translation inhibitor RaiA [Planctomycetota bacterium]